MTPQCNSEICYKKLLAIADKYLRSIRALQQYYIYYSYVNKYNN